VQHEQATGSPAVVGDDGGLYAGSSGNKPAELPIDQSSRFEFVVNLKTAKMLGVEIPTSVLGFASQVIE
jgi:putative ABC transport system substrate-binding protein